MRATSNLVLPGIHLMYALLLITVWGSSVSQIFQPGYYPTIEGCQSAADQYKNAQNEHAMNGYGICISYCRTNEKVVGQ